jgi:hypothetical protein
MSPCFPRLLRFPVTAARVEARSAEAYAGDLRPSRDPQGRPAAPLAGFPAGRTERNEIKGPCRKPRIAHGPLVVYPPAIRVVTPDRKDFVKASASR